MTIQYQPFNDNLYTRPASSTKPAQFCAGVTNQRCLSKQLLAGSPQHQACSMTKPDVHAEIHCWEKAVAHTQS